MSPGAKNKLRSLHGIKKIQALMIIGYAIIVSYIRTASNNEEEYI